MTALKALGGWKVEMKYPGALRRLILTQLVWLGIIVTALQIQNVFSLERLFVLWYFGFIISAHLFAPGDAATSWWRSVQIIVVLGFLVLSYIVLTRVFEVLAI